MTHKEFKRVLRLRKVWAEEHRAEQQRIDSQFAEQRKEESK